MQFSKVDRQKVRAVYEALRRLAKRFGKPTPMLRKTWTRDGRKEITKQ